MGLTQNLKAISGLSLILLILASVITGALLSYMWVVGYFENLKIRTPEKSDVTITNAMFSPQDTTFFNATIFNPSYSPSDAVITRITALTKDDRIHNVNTTYPPLEHKLPKATKYFPGSQTFKCLWNWANYTGEKVGIVAFLTDGSGPTFEVETPLVDLSITEIAFNPSKSFTRFNMTVENSNSSITHVDVSKIAIGVEGEATENVTEVTPITPALPQTIYPNGSVSFVCSWNWTKYQGKNVTVVVSTTQGYVAYYPKPPERTALPPPTDIRITDVLFNAANTTYFNVTVTNSPDSPTYVNITGIDLTVDNETISDIDVEPPHDLPYTLHPGDYVAFKCLWNWTDYREKNATILVHTLQNLTTPPYTKTTASRIILTITDILFDEKDTKQFNVTIQNSKFSLRFVNITEIGIITDYGESLVVYPSVNYTLDPGENATFTCVWNWTNYRGRNMMVTVYSLQNYTAYAIKTTPPRVTLELSNVSFDINDTTYFNVTAKNSEFSLDYVFITDIVTTLEDGTVKNVTVVPLRSLPHVLHPNQSASFMCLWDWSDYHGENFTVTVYTQQEYLAESTLPMPFVITEVLFNATDIEHFTITIQNSATSITYANITEITLAVEEGAAENVTEVTPALPHTLYPDQSKPFVCTWNWSAYEGKEVTIAVHTLQGYTAYAVEIIPERVMLEITDILFNVTDITQFNVTVRSSELSMMEANITEIIITIAGTAQNVTEFVPPLPYILQPGAKVMFKGSWNWTDFQGQMITITVRTSIGYIASIKYVLPVA